MPVETALHSLKVFNQHKNGSDFTLNGSDFTTDFTALVGEKVRVDTQINLTWWAEASYADEWNVQSGSITRTTGDFKADGFIVGQKIEFYPGATWGGRYYTAREFVATIDTISFGGKYMTFTVTAGSQSTTGSALTDCGIWADLTATPADAPDAVFFRWNLLPNGDTFSNVSLQTDEAQTYYLGGLTASDVAMNPEGTLQGWVSGSATAQKESTSYEKNAQTYLIKNTFVVLPFWDLSWLPYLQGIGKPPIYQNNTSLSYVFEAEFRHGLTQTTGAKTASITNLQGLTGWFGESFGGIQSDYSVGSATYTDTATADSKTGLQKYARTTCEFTLSKTSGSFASGQKIGVYFSHLPPSQAAFQQTATQFEENFIFDSAFHVAGQAATVGSGPIKYCEAILSSGNLEIEIQVEFSSSEQLKILAGNSYFVYVIAEDSGLTAVNSDRAACIVDAKPYSILATVSGLASWSKLDLFQHEHDYPGVGLPGPIDAWNEDGLLADWEFSIDTDRNAVIESIEFRLVAFKSATEEFTLDSYAYNLANTITGGGIQQINVSGTRGYVLKSGDQFNLITASTGAYSAPNQSYSGVLGQKISWQEWLQNLDVDTVFYDSAEPQDNLNEKTSNYSALNGYVIHIVGIVTLTGEDANGVQGQGIEKMYSAPIRVRDYDISDDNWVGDIKTFHPTTLSEITPTILTNVDTLFRAVWNHASTDLTDVYAIHRIERQNNPSDNIREMSSLRLPPAAGNILSPKTGETLTTLAVVGSDIHSECIIDHTQLDPNSAYRLSAKIKRGIDHPPNFTTSYVGCDLRLVNNYIGTISDIQYDFYLGATLIDTQNTTLGTFDWEAASLYAGETIKVTQTITPGGIVTESTLLFPAFTGCYIEYESNALGTDTVDPVAISAGTDHWRFPDNIARTGGTQFHTGSAVGFDGTTKSVRYHCTDFSGLSSFSFKDDKVLGVPDLSILTDCTTFEMDDNPGITSVLLPAINSSLVAIDLQNCGLTGTFFITAFMANLAGSVYLTGNPSLQNVIASSSSNTITHYRINLCNIGPSVSISMLSGIIDFIANDNPNLEEIVTGAHSANWNNFWAYNCDLQNRLDLSLYTGMGGDLRLGNNPDLEGIDNPSSSHPFTVYQADRCNLTGAWDGTTILIGGIFDLGENVNLTSVTHGASSEVIDAYRLDNCNLSTHDVSMLSALEGVFDIRDNPNLTALTLGATSGTFDLFTVSGCDLGYVDITNQTFASDADISFRDNNMTAAEVNQILVDLDNTLPGSGSGTIDVDGTNAAPDTTSGGYNGSAAVTSLQGKGYTVTTS